MNTFYDFSPHVTNRAYAQCHLFVQYYLVPSNPDPNISCSCATLAVFSVVSNYTTKENSDLWAQVTQHVGLPCNHSIQAKRTVADMRRCFVALKACLTHPISIPGTGILPWCSFLLTVHPRFPSSACCVDGLLAIAVTPYRHCSHSASCLHFHHFPHTSPQPHTWAYSDILYSTY